MSELGKPFPEKNQIKKQKISAKMQNVNKKALARNANLVQTKN